MKFFSKAKNLIFLKKLSLKNSKIPKFLKFSVQELEKNRDLALKIIGKNLGKKISIRSSFFLEDSDKSSMAGEFEGFNNVNNVNKFVNSCINNLILQYKKKTYKINYLKNSEILFQNYISNSKLSGVVTNYSIKDGSPYYVINYDDTSNLTNTVTSGGVNSGRAINIFRNNYKGLRSKNFKKVLNSIKEIESRIGNLPIDVEFAIDNKGILNIFQIRPISTKKKWKEFDIKKLSLLIYENQKKLMSIDKKNKLFGNYMIFGLMPDWNPVEMIGYQPNALSYSLYETLITNDAWNKSRTLMGYKNVDRPLMYKISGKPFIDARLSFYSFIPKNVPRLLAKKLVNFWSKKLINKSYLHDKIEFEIADGSFDASTSLKIKSQYNFLNYKEKKLYKKELKNFTNHKIANFKVDFNDLNKKLIFLENKRIKFVHNIKNQNKFLNYENIKKEIDNLKKFGIIPFSVYARYAFIGKKFLISLKNNKFIKDQTYLKLINSIDTITTEYIRIKNKSKTSTKFKKKFDNYFYHLRPGTYDINTNRYKGGLKLRKIDDLERIIGFDDAKSVISKIEKRKINYFLKKNNFDFDYKHLLSFCLSAIKLRENSKFIFTRSLSDILESMRLFSKKKGFNFKKNSKYLSLSNFLKINKNSKRTYSEKMDSLFKLNQIVKVPFLITNKNDLLVASNLLTKPNFITKKVIRGNTKHLEKEKDKINLKNKIVLIENADPGFDWIFSYNILGLITKYGGVNSHMSIRCEEMNVAAAIGIGNENFEKIKDSNKVILNCKNEQVSIIS